MNPHHLQRRQFVDDHAPSMAHHYQFWQHQGNSQPPFFPLQRQGEAEGEENLVLATHHELGPNGSHQPLLPVNFKLGLNENSSCKLGAKNEWRGVPDGIMRDFYNKNLQGGKDLDLEDKCRLYGELEDIYGLSKTSEFEANRAGSLSELTGENSSANAGISVQLADNVPNQIVDRADNLVGEKRKRKRKLNETMSSMAGFFESLVKRVMDHQDALYRNFLDVVERMDAERKEAENEWRRKEAAMCDNEAIARAREKALAMSREAQIVSYVEKLSGQSIGLPRIQSRWPKAEVEALIRARSSVESRLQDPGSKGSIWEEVSRLMDTMGYQRSTKRCKEKWENINKYFKKVKESGAQKRRHQSKSCSYFNQLDQLHSRESQCLPELVEGFVALGQHEENAGSVTTSRIEFDSLNDDHFEYRDVNHGDGLRNDVEAQEQCGVTAAD